MSATSRQNSLERIEKSLDEFFLSTDQKVLMLKGSWGSGKTFFLKDYISRRRKRRLLPKWISFISIFGCQNLGEIEARVVASYHPLSIWSKGASIGLFSWLRGVVTSLQLRPFILSVNFTTESMLWTIAKRLPMLIILDDLERYPKCMDLADILGLASGLTESTQSKIILVCNTDKLATSGATDIITLREKTIQKEVLFAPSVRVAVDSFFEYKDGRDTMIECLTTIDECNIRLIDRVSNLISDVRSVMRDNSVTLSKDQYDEIIRLSVLILKSPLDIDLSFLWTRESIWESSQTESRQSDDQSSAARGLRNRLQVQTSICDAMVIEWFKQGYFSVPVIDAAVSELKKLGKMQAYDTHQTKAYSNLFSNFRTMNLSELQSNINKFVELNHSAMELNEFVHHTNTLIELEFDTRDLWSTWIRSNCEQWSPQTCKRVLRHCPYEELRVLLEARIAVQAEQPSISDTLSSIADSESWNQDQLDFILSSDVETWLLQDNSDEVFSTVRILLRTFRRSSSDSKERQVYDKMRQALESVLGSGPIATLRRKALKFDDED